MAFLLIAFKKRIFEKIVSYFFRMGIPNFLSWFFSLFIFSILFIAVKFPFTLYTGFFRLKNFAILKSDFFTWFIRYSASTVISLLIFSAVLTLFILFVKKSEKFTIFIPIFIFVFSLAYSIFYPRYITPLFYEKGEYPNNSIKNEIFIMSNKSGVDPLSIEIIKKSAYSSSANAYMIGFGPWKKIVLYDSLFTKFSKKEVLSILAHEMGHYIEEDMFKGVLMGSIGFISVLVLLYVFSKIFLLSRVGDFVKMEYIPLLFIVLIFILFLSQPVENYISRKIEFRADNFALKLLNSGEDYINMESKISKINKSNILPNKQFVMFYYSHPQVLERLKNAEKYR